MPYLLALLSAAFYGAADFMGGLAARGAAIFAVVTVTQLAGLVLLVIFLPFLPEADPSAADLTWGLAAGVAGSIGVALLYRALAVGTMSIVAPTTAVCAVAIPVMVDLVAGEWPPIRTSIGIALALIAIVLISQQPSDVTAPPARVGRAALPPGIGLALASGVAIGLFFLALAQTAPAAGLWPLLPARAISVVLFAALAAGRAQVRMPARVVAIAVAGGSLDMIANALYLLAVTQGALAPVVTLSSLYPAGTVLLARVVLHERLTPLQVVGIVTALGAVALIVA